MSNDYLTSVGAVARAVYDADGSSDLPRVEAMITDLHAEVLDGYSQTLNELREVGYLTYAKRQLSPYLRACVDQFSQQRPTLTQRLLARTRKN